MTTPIPVGDVNSAHCLADGVPMTAASSFSAEARPASPTPPPALCRFLVGLAVALAVFAFAADSTGDWLANDLDGAAVALPVGALVWASLEVAALIARVRR